MEHSCVDHGPYASGKEVKHSDAAIEAMAEAISLFEEAEYWLDRYNDSIKPLEDLGYQLPRVFGEYQSVFPDHKMFSGRHLPVIFADGPDFFPVPKPRPTRAQLIMRLGEQFRWLCIYCQRTGTTDCGPDGRVWHLDHGYPKALGGDDDPENMILSCATCNLRKQKKTAMELLRRCLAESQS